MPKHRRSMPRRRRLAVLSGTTILALGVASAVIVNAASGTADASRTITVQASADATINSAQPDSNRGSSMWVTADGEPVRYGFYRFHVSTPSGVAITRAEFRCLSGSSNDFGASLWITSSEWDEQTITWANAPRPDVSGKPVGSTGPVTRHQWASADVTGQVSRSGTYTFVTASRSGVAWSCASRENRRDEPAELVLTTATPTPATSPPISSSPAPSTTPPAPSAGHKMLVIPLENHSQSEALSQMPHLAGWSQTFGQATSY